MQPANSSARSTSLAKTMLLPSSPKPIQGAGGVLIPPESYWPEVKRVLDERDILLVADEVICGFGRTGKWFGSEYYELTPDLMPIAKGLSSGYLPIGGVMVADRMAGRLDW